MGPLNSRGPGTATPPCVISSWPLSASRAAASLTAGIRLLQSLSPPPVPLPLFSPRSILRGTSLGQQVVPGLRERRRERIAASSSATTLGSDSEASEEVGVEVETAEGGGPGHSSPAFSAELLLLFLIVFCLEVFAALIPPLGLFAGIWTLKFKRKKSRVSPALKKTAKKNTSVGRQSTTSTLCFLTTFDFLESEERLFLASFPRRSY
jgi:hypothetical protein